MTRGAVFGAAERGTIGHMRTVFAVYVALIVAGLAAALAIALSG